MPSEGVFAPRGSRRRGFVLLWVVLGVFLVLRTAGRDRGVITDHLEFGRRLFAGEALYAPYLEDRPLHPVYPPSFGLLTGPFSVLPETAARAAWGVLQVGALWVIGAWLVAALRRAAPESARLANVALLGTLVLGARYVLRDTHGGGGNLINLALAVGAFWLAERGRWGWGAVLLGFSLATKPTTALVVPVLLAAGHVRLAGGSVVAVVAFLGAALLVHGRGLEPLLLWGEGAIAYGSQQDLFAPPHLDLPPFTWMNQCLRCAVARYLGTVPEEYAVLVPGFVPGAGLPPVVTAWVARVLSAVVLGVTLGFAFRLRGRFEGRFRALAVALAAGVLLSPISWKAHHVALLPAMFAVVVAGLRGDRGARVLAVGYFVFCVVGGGDLVGDAVKEWQQSLYLATFGAVVLWGWVLRRGLAARGADAPPAGSALLRPPPVR